MATPHVSGIAAMLFSLDPDIKGNEVKEIIKKTAQIDVKGCTYKMVNAEDAVKEMLGRWYISGKVVGGSHVPLEGVTVSLNCIYGAGGEDFAARTTTAKDGTFSIEIPEGITGLANLTFSKEGYDEHKLSLEQYSIKSNVDVGTIQMNATTKMSFVSGPITDSSTRNGVENVNIDLY